MYEEKLAMQYFNPLDEEVKEIVNRLQGNSEKPMTKLQFHSKKKYLKNKGDLVGILKLVIAWEIVAMEGKSDV